METKSREEVLAERKLRKDAKQSKKQKSKSKPSNDSPQEKTPCVNGDNKKITEVSEAEICTPAPGKISTKKNKGIDSATTTPSKQPEDKILDVNELGKKIVNLKVSESKRTSSVSPGVSPKADKLTQSPSCNANVPETGAGKSVEPTSGCDGKAIGTTDESQATDVTKSKAQLKAERRAKQEAQRALKAQKKSSEETSKTDSIKPVTAAPPAKKSMGDKTRKANDPNKVKMVSHLALETDMDEFDVLKKCGSGIHQSMIKLGLQYKHKVIIGSNARVVALLNTFKQVLMDYECEHDFPREFEVTIERSMQYLRTCRPPSVSMTNAVKVLRWHLTQLPNDISISDAQVKLCDVIADYLEKIDLAGKAISESVRKKISQDDVILTFGYSSLIKRILKESFKSGVKFRVVIVDAGPLYEGKQLLKQLAKKNLHCTYVLLSAVSNIMKEATKVLLGAHALLTNGYVMSRAGASQIALIATLYNVPVLVCCESHKFSEQVQTDALVYNELVNVHSVSVDTSPSNKCQTKSHNYMKSLTLMYDVTPPDLVTSVVTELGILPGTSVPVVLRIKPATPFN